MYQLSSWSGSWADTPTKTTLLVCRRSSLVPGRDRPSTRTVRSPRRIQRKLTPDEVSDLVELRRNGCEIDALAERFGVGRSTVMEQLKRAGVPGRRWQGRTLSPEQLEEAGRLYESGLNLIAVAEQFDVDRRYLRRALPSAGFAVRNAGQRKRI
jgi:hypothetical protein